MRALIVIALLAAQSSSSKNLVINGDARAGLNGWRAHGQAAVEAFAGVPCFVLRNQGSFTQIIPMRQGAAGNYVALVARGESERINGIDESITGLPYLYAMPATEPPSRFLGHWQASNCWAGQRIPPDGW